MTAVTRVTAAACSGLLLAGLVGVATAAPSPHPARAIGTQVSSDDSHTDLRAAETRARRASTPRQDFNRPSNRPGQTSDGVRGIKVGPRVDQRSKPGVARVKNDMTYEIAPGIQVREWDQVDGRKPVGQIRAQLVTVSLDAPNISFDYLSSKYITKRKTVSQLGAMNSAIAAVNGDFFDISDTGAPLGVGIDADLGLRQGSKTGWIPENTSLWFDAAGPHISPLKVKAKIRQHPKWKVDHYNAPTVSSGGIGLYTSDWGWTKGYSVTDGEQKGVREVTIVDGRVVSNRTALTKGRKIKGQVLVGRGSGAAQLKSLTVGRRITFKPIVKQPGVITAITGDRPILIGGVQTVINDQMAHPRTAVGVDADGRKLLILVIDGRSTFSRGYTMVELAQMMTALGAEDAINLDGGGSSTMYTRRVTGDLGVINEPSDGKERLVPNGFGVFYHGELPPVVPITPPTPIPTPIPTPVPTPVPTPTIPPPA